MVIDDLYVERVSIVPPKTDSPLIVDTNTVLPLPSAFEPFEPVGRRHPEVLKGPGTVEHPKLP